MQILGKVPHCTESYKLTICDQCKSIILYKLSETQVVEHPEEKYCTFWLTCPACQKNIKI